MIWKTKLVEITAEKQNMEGGEVKRNEDSLRDFWDNIKGTNIHIIRIQEKRESRDL